MKTLSRTVVLLAVALAFGCSGKPSMKSDPIDVTGTVTGVSGQPVGNVTLSFLPASSSLMTGSAALKADGKFAAKLIPGKYTILFEGNPAVMAAIPTKYHSNDAANVIEIPSGDAPVAIKLTN